MHFRRGMRLAGAASAGILIAVVSFAAQAAKPSVAATPGKERAAPTSERPLDLPIAIDGPSVAAAAKEPGRLVRLAFDAKAGQRLGLGISGVKMSPASASALVVTVRDPDDALLPTGRIHCFAPGTADPSGGCDGEFTTTKSGRHIIEVDPPFSASASFAASLSTPAHGTLAPDRPQNVVLRRAGQDARFDVATGAGSGLSIEARAAGPQPQGGFALRVYDAGGKLVAQVKGTPERGASLPLTGAPGTYVVEIDPDHGMPGTYTLSARGAGTLALGGPPVPFAATAPDEVVRFALLASAGQKLVLAVDALAHAPDVDSNSMLSVLNPDGSRLGGSGCMTHPILGMQPQPCKLEVTIPAAGRYTVAIGSPWHATVAGRLLASEARSGTLASGATQPLDTMTQAQVARFTFAGVAGQSVGVELAKLSVAPPGTMVRLSLVRPEGFPVAMMSGREGTVKIGPTALPVAGTYTVTVDPGLGTVTSGEVRLVASEGKSQ